MIIIHELIFVMMNEHSARKGLEMISVSVGGNTARSCPAEISCNSRQNRVSGALNSERSFLSAHLLRVDENMQMLGIGS